MALLDIRQRFAFESGRHDLVVDFAGEDYSNNGADYYLDAGQKLLDRKAVTQKSYSWHKVDIAVDAHKIILDDCLVVKRVEVSTDEARWKLTFKDYEWVKQYYGTSISSIDSGIPLYFTLISTGLDSSQAGLVEDEESEDYFGNVFTRDFEEITFGDHFRKLGILFLPPTAETLTVSILGKFYSQRLDVEDGDEITTYWTEANPDLLILAAMYCLDRSYRNFEGMKSHMAAIDAALFEISKSVVEQEIVDVDRVED